jgi:hypothetical protein
MRLFSAWKSIVRGGRVSDTTQTRLAFQSGARFVLTEMLDVMEDIHDDKEFDAVAKVIERLNDEIRDFARVALLESGLE